MSANDSVAELYDRRQPYIVAMLFGVFAVVALGAVGALAVDSELQVAFLLGLFSVAGLAALGGYFRGAPVSSRKPSGRRGAAVGAASGAAGLLLLSAADEVVLVVVAMVVPYVAWNLGRAQRESSKISREIATLRKYESPQ